MNYKLLSFYSTNCGNAHVQKGVVKQMSGAAGNDAVKEKNKSNKPFIIIIAVLIVAVIAAIVVVIVLLMGRGSDAGRETASSVRTVVDQESAQNVMNEMREEVAEGMFECEMTTNWTFPNGRSESSDAYVANNVNNTHPIYFDVYMNGTNELVYSSPILPVGSEIANFKLDKELPAGDYKATVMYNLLESEKNQEVISSAGFVVTIKVLK